MWMLAAILICGTSVFMACSSNEDAPVPKDPESEKSDVVDYSDKNNWMRQPEATKDVDAFFMPLMYSRIFVLKFSRFCLALLSTLIK